MKRFIFKSIILAITFCVGVVCATVVTKLRAANAKRPSSHATARPVAMQAPTPSISNTVDGPKLESLSPYAVKEFINGSYDLNEYHTVDLKDLWQRLGIGLRNSDGHSLILDICNNCKAETYEYELDEEQGKEVLLRVAGEFGGACRYLVFKRDDGQTEAQWKLLGYIDDDLGKYGMPQHFYFLSGGKNWLVIQMVVGSGSGVSLYWDRVFTVSKHGVKEVLHYVSEGDQTGYPRGETRDFAARLIDFEERKNSSRFVVEFTVKYSIYDGDSRTPVLNKKQRAVYVKRSNSITYHFDASESDLSRHELESVYNIDSLTSEDFLKYNHEDLLRIARGNNEKLRDWLRQYLDECSNVSQKRELRKALMSN